VTAPRLPAIGGLEWSVCVRDSGGAVLYEVGADLRLRTASVGKVLLLLETARQLASGALSPDEPLTRSPALWVGDSGLWHTLSVDTLPLVDVAALVGAVSDNLATNVLLHRVGLDAVGELTRTLGLAQTALHDRVRDRRTQHDPPTLSTGTARELSNLASRIAAGDAVGPEADGLVRAWLSANVDQSMVGSAFVERIGLDPIAHHLSLAGDRTVWNKTGTDSGVRADVGAVTSRGRTISWAAVAQWVPSHDQSIALRQITSAFDGMRRVGHLVLDATAPRTGRSSDGKNHADVDI
jgi:beta-lactamase class A